LLPTPHRVWDRGRVGPGSGSALARSQPEAIRLAPNPYPPHTHNPRFLTASAGMGCVFKGSPLHLSCDFLQMIFLYNAIGGQTNCLTPDYMGIYALRHPWPCQPAAVGMSPVGSVVIIAAVVVAVVVCTKYPSLNGCRADK
jgi:hypothetical protein